MCSLGCSLFASGLINSPHGQLWSLFIVLLTFCDPFIKVGGCRNASLLTWIGNTCSSSLTSSFNLSIGVKQASLSPFNGNNWGKVLVDFNLNIFKPNWI